MLLDRGELQAHFATEFYVGSIPKFRRMNRLFRVPPKGQTYSMDMDNWPSYLEGLWLRIEYFPTILVRPGCIAVISTKHVQD
jgi:hypothetical protein